MIIVRKTFFAFLVSAVIISSCGGGGDKGSQSGPYVPPANVSVSSISISITAKEIAIGETLQLSATVSPSNATDKTISWSSSNANVASVSPTGLVTGKAEGSTDIKATCDGKSATCKITVKKPIVAVASVELDKTDITLDAEETITLKATVKPDNATEKTVTWGSSKESIATVDNSGKVTGVDNGVASITASCGGKSASCKVTVVVQVKSISLNKTELTLEIGKSETLTATIKPDNAKDKTITWSSTNAAVAAVDNNGKVTAIATGTAIIKASSGTQTATCNVTVTNQGGLGSDIDIPGFGDNVW